MDSGGSRPAVTMFGQLSFEAAEFGADLFQVDLGGSAIDRDLGSAGLEQFAKLIGPRPNLAE